MISRLFKFLTILPYLTYLLSLITYSSVSMSGCVAPKNKMAFSGSQASPIIQTQTMTTMMTTTTTTTTHLSILDTTNNSNSSIAATPRTTAISVVPHRRRPSQPISPVIPGPHPRLATTTEPIEVVVGGNVPPDRGDALMVPTKPSHWESVKDVIEELYIHKNVRLKDVIEIMQVLYKFRAT